MSRMDPMTAAKDRMIDSWEASDRALKRSGYDFGKNRMTFREMAMLEDELVPPEPPEITAYREEKHRQQDLDLIHRYAKDKDWFARYNQGLIDALYQSWLKKHANH